VPANVRSIPALADFRAALVTFGDSARRALDEVRMEVQRGLMWITDEQPIFWKGEQQRSWDLVAEKRNELDQCERKALDGQRPTCYQERKALEAAKRYVRFVEEKIDTVRAWGRRLVTETSEYEGQVSGFRDLLEIELPRAVALLERMIGSLEAYTSVVAAPVTATLGQEPQSIIRTTPEPEAAPAISVFQPLRELTPSLQKRQAAGMLPPDKLQAAIDEAAALRAAKAAEQLAAEADETETKAAPVSEGPCQQAALKLAYDLGLEPVFPNWQAKVVLVTGCLAAAQVFAERIEAPNGDSGWFIGLVEPELGAPPQYEAMPLAALVSLRPALLAACALPPGYLAVFSHDELVAVVNTAGEDVWERHLRSSADEQLKGKS
jgi:hypothetical protein